MNSRDKEASREESVETVLDALARHGLLFKQDKTLPNVVGIVTGESLRTSWWIHPKSHLIFSVLSSLADDPQVLITKLLSRKDTLVHSALWPALVAVGCARASWQSQSLSSQAADLLNRIDCGESVRAAGPAAKELQMRLLAITHEAHTESGRHELEFESWSAWSRRVNCKALNTGAEGRQLLELAATQFGAPLKALPWWARTEPSVADHFSP
jgi:hypothetical protein